MALEKIDTNENFSGVTGVFTGQGDTPMFLGEKNKSFSLKDYFGSANIVVGFDTRISPAQLRIFYQNQFKDPGISSDKHYGLMMTKQISFDGFPIPPSVYSAAIRYQDNYSSFVKNNVFSHVPVSNAFAVDMMPPNEYVQHGLVDPYFAYNAVLHESDFKMEDVYKTNAVNGFLTSYANTGLNEQPLCAALFAPIAIDVEAPFASDIDEFIKHQEKQNIEPVGRFEISAQEITDGLLLDKVLHVGDSPIPVEDIVDMKMIGDYMVITLEDEENYNPVLIVDPWQKCIYLYDVDLMEDIQKKYTRKLFNRLNNFFETNNRSVSFFPTMDDGDSETLKHQVRRMRSGGDHYLSCDYRVYAVERWTIPGTTEYAHHCMGGVQFSVRRKFDKEQLQFAELEIASPQSLQLNEVINFNRQLYQIYHPSSFDKNLYMPELLNYYNSLKTEFPFSINTFQRFRTFPPLSPTIVR